MVVMKSSNIKLLQTLRSLNKPYFTVADLEKVLGLKRDVLYVTLSRLVNNGTLIRLKKGIYQPEFQSLEIEKTANELYYPSYLSFESALSRYGILSQIPYTQTFATTKKSKKMILWETEVEFRQLKKDLFFGYKMEEGMYVAQPEKALLDQLYMVARGKGSLNIKELDLKEVNKELFEQYARRFPSYIKKLLNKVRIGFGVKSG